VRDNPAGTLYRTIPSYGRREELASRFAGSVEDNRDIMNYIDWDDRVETRQGKEPSKGL
jgi:hypothetical protein